MYLPSSNSTCLPPLPLQTLPSRYTYAVKATESVIEIHKTKLMYSHKDLYSSMKPTMLNKSEVLASQNRQRFNKMGFLL